MSVKYALRGHRSCIVALVTYVMFEFDVAAVNMWYQTCERIGTAFDGITVLPQDIRRFKIIRLAPLQVQWMLYIPPGFNIQKFYILPTECICVFCLDLWNKQYLQYFLMQHYLTVFFRTET